MPYLIVKIREKHPSGLPMADVQDCWKVVSGKPFDSSYSAKRWKDAQEDKEDLIIVEFID